MSYYDTENMMQTKGNGYLQKALVDVNLLSDFIEESIKVLYKLEPEHCKSAYYHTVVKGENNTYTRMDQFLGIDNILEYETLNGNTIFIAIDWTDDPMKVEYKAQRMQSRKEAYDVLGISLCLCVCVDNQVLLRGTRQEQEFINNAYGLIFDRIDSMLEKQEYSSALSINMGALVK